METAGETGMHQVTETTRYSVDSGCKARWGAERVEMELHVVARARQRMRVALGVACVLVRRLGCDELALLLATILRLGNLPWFCTVSRMQHE
jgi:hypothetical protein